MYKIDAHNHADWHGHNFEKFIDNIEKNGISKTWLLSWEAPRDDYDPETINVFPLSRASWNELGEANSGPIPFSLGYEYYTKTPERFILGYAPDPRRPDSLKRLQSAVSLYGVKICGEIKLRMMYDNPDAVRMFRWCGENGLPVTLHFDYEESTNTNKNFPRPNWWYGGGIDVLERLLVLCPETNFLGHAPGFWCHISNDDLGKTQSYPKGEVISGGKIEYLLDKYSNLYCDMSAGSCHNALSRDFDYTYKLISKHPGRFLYARDCFYNIHDQLIKKLSLSENILEMIYYKNACKLINTEY